MLSGVASGAVFENRAGYTDAGLTSYNGTYTRHRVKVTAVAAGPLTPGGTVSVGLTNSHLDSSGTFATATVDSSGNLGPLSVTYYTRSPVADGDTVTLHNFNAAVAQSNAGAQTYTTTILQTKRRNIQGNQGGSPRTIELQFTIAVYPTGYLFGNWNVELCTRARGDLPVDYALQWDGDANAQLRSIPASATRTNVVQLWTKNGTSSDPETAPSKVARLYRRIAGGSWVLLATATVPFNGLVRIFDEPQPDAGFIDTSSNDSSGLSATASVVDPTTGTATGTLTSTTGNGFTLPAGSGSGGSGSGDVTVNVTVDNGGIYDEVKQALDDSSAGTVSPTVPDNPTFSDVPVPTGAQAAADGIKAKVEGMLSTAGTLAGSAEGFGNQQVITLPSVSGRKYSEAMTLPLLGSVNLSWQRYQTIIEGFRSFVLCILLILLNVYGARIIRSAFT